MANMSKQDNSEMLLVNHERKLHNFTDTSLDDFHNANIKWYSQEASIPMIDTRYALA